MSLMECLCFQWKLKVDEQLLRFREWCSFKQFIPSKPRKYGINTWAMCYVKMRMHIKFKFQLGKNHVTGQETNQVAFDLVKETHKTSRNITCGKIIFFVSFFSWKWYIQETAVSCMNSKEEKTEGKIK